LIQRSEQAQQELLSRFKLQGRPGTYLHTLGREHQDQGRTERTFNAALSAGNETMAQIAQEEPLR
jgi:hypothetical protein